MLEGLPVLTLSLFLTEPDPLPFLLSFALTS